MRQVCVLVKRIATTRRTKNRPPLDGNEIKCEMTVLRQPLFG
jgi:hypothetical protein